MSADVAESKPTPVSEPPPKKPRLFKLNGPRRQSEDSGDSITVAQPGRKKDKNIRFKYSGDMIMTKEEHKAQTAVNTRIESTNMAGSPAPSSGLSSLSSAPPSEKETSPFADPAPVPRSQEYGDFLSYYVEAADEDPDAISRPPPAAKATDKATSKTASKAASKVASKSTPKQKVPKLSAPAPQPPVPPPVQLGQTQQLYSPHTPMPQQGSDPSYYQHHAPPQQHSLQASSRSQHASPADSLGMPLGRSTMQVPPHHRPAPISQPIIQFSEIVHPPPPDSPDTVAVMIKKLRKLSVALAAFGAAPPTPSLSSVPPLIPSPTTTPNGNADNPLDNFLSFFDGDDDVGEMNRPLKNPGTLDGPLTHGIIFIQNALKSWAQTRVAANYANQYQEQNRQVLNAQQQSNGAKRGPGRPRKFDEPANLLPPSPVIRMALADTPEGMAIKAFQAVLHSECLRINVRLPIALADALRQLYMQIDLLINQGEREPRKEWQCMSYGAQISANKIHIERIKAHQEKVHEETQRQQSIAHQNMMAQMALPQQHRPMSTQQQAAHMHAVELETRRAQAHAQQQPYIRQQHLNPLQLGPRPPGPPGGFLPSQPAINNMLPASVGPPDGRADPKVQVPLQQGVPSQQASSSPGVQLDKMKLYVPGYLPLSGQSMKWSFAPQNHVPMQPLGSNAYSSIQGSIPGTPDKLPMSAPPTHRSSQPPADLIATSPAGARAVTAPIDPDSAITKGRTPILRAEARQSIVQSPTPADSSQPAPDSNFRSHQLPQAPAIASHGFTAVNAPAARPNSIVHGTPTDTSPETIKVSSKKLATSPASSSSPRESKKRSANRMKGQKENTTMPSRFPHPGAIVLDE